MPAAALALRWTRDFDELLSVLPEGQAGAPVLVEMARLLAIPPRPGEPAADPFLRGRCDREAIQRNPALITPRVREAEARLQALASHEPLGLCSDRGRCHEEILEHADAIALAQPDATVAVTLRARLLIAEDRAEEAAKMLETACDQVTDRPSCLQVRVEAAARSKAMAPLDAASKALLGASCVSAEACASTASYLASIRLGRGETGAALALLARAAREDPSNEARWLQLADAASHSGAHAQAAEALEKVARHRGGADAALQGKMEAERSQARSGLLH